MQTMLLCHLALLEQMRDIKLTGLVSLRTLHLTLLWSAQDGQDTVLAVWGKLLRIIKTAPALPALRSVTIENPFPMSILRSGWSQAMRSAVLRTTLYHVDKRLVDVVDGGVLQAVTFIPQRVGSASSLQTQIFLDSEKARIRALFQALAAYDMLDFLPTAD